MFDESLINLCYRSLDRVVCLCLQPELNLKNSPPYILDTIPDLYEKLQSILAHYEPNLDQLGQIDYFQIFVKSLIDRCRITIRLFKESKTKLFDPNSTARSRLTKLSLIFSHLLKDLTTLFPHNRFDLANYRITKLDASNWWSAHFPDLAIVSWTLFFQTLSQTFPDLSGRHASRLKQTIDLTCNDYVSIFEFDVFTRLFQPWSNIIQTWEALTIHHPGYMSFMTYDEFKAILTRFRSDPGPGTYVFRISCTKPGQWVIGYITEDLRILQTIIQNKSLAQALLDGEREGFYLFPNGKPSPKRLLYELVHNQTLVHVQVTQEQYQTYCEAGSTFELCKICDEHNKDVQLEPCRHLICRNCLLNCQLTGNGQTCPFCRLEIKGVEEVIVDPYKPRRRRRSGPIDACGLVRLSSLQDMAMMFSSSSSPSSSSTSSPTQATVALDRQISLPSAQTQSAAEDNQLNTTNRSLSVNIINETDSHDSLSKDLIDLSDSADKKPPPVPPRHSSRSPPILMSTTPTNQCIRLIRRSKCPIVDHATEKSDPDPDSQCGQPSTIDPTLVPLVMTSSCLSFNHCRPSDSDRCQCTGFDPPLSIAPCLPPSLPPPPLPTTTTSYPTIQLLSGPNQVAHKSDLHYAQLDLVDSDSDMEIEPDLNGHKNSTTSDQQSGHHRHHHHPLSSSLSPPPSSGRPNCPAPNDDPTTTTAPTMHSPTLPTNRPTQTHLISSESFVPTPNHYDQLNQRTCERPVCCDLCRTIMTPSAAATTTVMAITTTIPGSSTRTSCPNLDQNPSASSLFEHNLNQLVHAHPDMARHDGLLLLSLTENRLDMAHRIWEHFQPRTR